MDVGIVAQRGNDRATSLAGTLTEQLRSAGVTVVVDRSTAAVLADPAAESGARDSGADDTGVGDRGPGDPGAETAAPTGVDVEEMAARDLVVSIGGDGTFLYTARAAGGTPILGVNLGEVGFLNAVAPEEAVDVVLEEVERIREDGAARTTEMDRLKASGEGWSLAPALNEVVVHGPRRGHGGGAEFVARVDGSSYTSGHADGILVATPTGSTAYNLSEGGPLVHPDVDGLVVTEMAGESGMPPLVVDEDSEITVRIEGADEGVVVSDGRARQAIEPPTEVRIERAGDPVRAAGPPRDFFAALGKLD